MDGVQDFVFDLHELFRLFERGFVLGHDQRHGVAKVVRQAAHGDERILILFEVADLVLALGRDVLRREHGQHAVQRLGAAGVDRPDARPRVLRAHRAAVGHAGDVPVVGVFAVAQHLFLHVQPVDAGAELPVALRRLRHAAELFVFGRQTHGGENFDVARAAAVVVAQGVFNVRLGRIGVFVQQGLGAQHHARDAEAALHRAGFAIAVGIQLLFPVCQALHRDHVPPVQRIGIGRAGADGIAVDEHGARAARALGAAVLHGREPQLVAQIAQKLLVFFGADLLPVHKENRHLQTFLSRYLRHSKLFSACSATASSVSF